MKLFILIMLSFGVGLAQEPVTTIDVNLHLVTPQQKVSSILSQAGQRHSLAFVPQTKPSKKKNCWLRMAPTGPHDVFGITLTNRSTWKKRTSMLDRVNPLQNNSQYQLLGTPLVVVPKKTTQGNIYNFKLK